MNEKKDAIIDKFFSFLLIFPLFEIEGISKYLPISREYLVLLDVAFVFCLYIVNFEVTKSEIACLLFFAPIVISTLINHREVFSAIYYMLLTFCLVLIIEYYKQRKMLLYLLQAIKLEMGLLIIINLIFQLTAQDFFGYTHAKNYVNFFVSDNFLCYYYVPFILIVYLTKLSLYVIHRQSAI